MKLKVLLRKCPTTWHQISSLNIDIKTHKPLGEYHIYIYSKEDILIGFEQTIFPNDRVVQSMVDKGVSCAIIKKLQNLVSKGFHKNEGLFSKDTELRLVFLWQ